MHYSHQIKVTKHKLSRSMKMALKHWYQKRYVNGKDTSELMDTVHDNEARRALSIVALLDVGTMNLSGLMDVEEFQFIQTCHSYLKTTTDHNMNV